MFARQTTMYVKSENVDRGIKIYEESVVPAAKMQKGFKGAYLLVDRKTGKSVSITLWDSEEDAIANEKNLYYQEQLIKGLRLYTKLPINEGYEVAVKA